VLGILAQLIEHIQDKVLMMVDGIAGVQYSQEYLLKENNHFLFQMLSEMHEKAVENG